MSYFAKWLEIKAPPTPTEQLADRFSETLHSAFWLKQTAADIKVQQDVLEQIKSAIELLHDAGKKLGFYF